MNPAKRTGTMRVFHRTSSDTAADIRIMGFYDASEAVGVGAERMGVWVSAQPMDASEDAVATLVTLRIPIALFERHEHRHGFSSHRDALISADDLNACGQARIVSAEAEARWINLRLRAFRGQGHTTDPTVGLPPGLRRWLIGESKRP